jgi:putative transposase
MAHENPLWGAPRIHGELLKLGVQVSQAKVTKYMARPATPPSQSWRTFLADAVQQIAAADFFVVPTATYRLRARHPRTRASPRRSCRGDASAHRRLDRPTAARSIPWDPPPAYLIHDRDLAFQGLRDGKGDESGAI